MPRAQVARDVCHTVASEVRAFCVKKADAARVQKYARYFTEGYDAYGVDHRDPEWEANRHAWGERLQAAGPSAYLDAGDLLLESGKYEEASFAILIAEDAAGRYNPAAFDRIGNWFEKGIRNWGHTDVLCGRVLSRFFTHGVIGLDAIRGWVSSPHKYQRRAVPVTFITLLDGKWKLNEFLEIVEPLMMDREKVVQQGMGWFLREAWKRHAKPVEAFLMKYKDTSPRLIFQYATEKMDKPARDRFRAAKPAAKK